MKIRNVARSCLFSIVLVLVVPVSAYAANVIADGKEWRQVTETVNTSWDTLASTCDAGTGVCGGAYVGWTWASKSDVASLFGAFLGSQASSPFTSYVASDSSAASFLTMFAPTFSFSFSTVYGIMGVTRDAPVYSSHDGLNYAYGGFVTAYSDSTTSVFNLTTVHSTNSSNPTVGAWMYASAAPVPEPEIYAMMGLGLGLMGWAGHQKRLKEAQSA